MDKRDELRLGFETAYIDGSVASNSFYSPQFVSNNYKDGKKVLSSIEDELLRCDKFQISVAFITLGGITPLLQTLKELEKKNKEIQELENENIEISKKRHTIVHKQKSLERKLEEIIMKSEISTEEAVKVKVRLEKLNSEIYNKKEVIELDKTGIENIDDMLKYMQIECIKNKIDFTLKITGNIYYMINNLINKEDLETLLADHIKDAIIAINHTENINKSILVRLGDIDGNYGLYIYDSGVEFPKEVLENLGKKPCTTYKNEGGTGMGFMNTFDTLRKCNASLIIEELNEPKEDNYTKIVEIKFDKKNEFKVNSYKNKNR